MNQLDLFEVLPVPAARASRPAPTRQIAASEARGAWEVGMLVRLPVTASIQGERWRQYTTGLPGRVEVIEDDQAFVRIASAGHKFDGKLALAHLAGLSAYN